MARPVIVKAPEAKPGPEKKHRLQEALDRLAHTGPSPEMVRPARALELLERLATPQARQQDLWESADQVGRCWPR